MPGQRGNHIAGFSPGYACHVRATSLLVHITPAGVGRTHTGVLSQRHQTAVDNKVRNYKAIRGAIRLKGVR